MALLSDMQGEVRSGSREFANSIDVLRKDLDTSL